MKTGVMQLAEFIRSFDINSGIRKLFFLGAGASLTSGVPTAAQCIWNWKQSIFLSNNHNLLPYFSDASLPSNRKRIQQWLDSKGNYPEDGSLEEYSYYVNECFPRAADRRQYFQSIIKGATPYIGYKLLGLLHQCSQIDSVWTTNFDNLVARAALEQEITAIEIGIDSLRRLDNEINETDLLCVSLHGDYRYDSLKNTETELQTQEARLQNELQSRLQRTPAIVIGYSGRDRSVIQMFEKAYCSDVQPKSPLYWCGYGAMEDNPLAAELVQKIIDHGHEAYYVPSNGFDDLLDRLASYVSRDESTRQMYEQIVSSFNNRGKQSNHPFDLPDLLPSAVIKANAYELDCPLEAFSFELTEWPDRRWKHVREKTKGFQVVAVPFKNGILAFGEKSEIHKAFFGCISGEILRVPINEKDLSYEDGAINHLMRNALVRSIAETCGLNTDGERTLWPNEHVLTKRSHLVYDSLEISIKTLNRKLYLALMPGVYLLAKDGSPVSVGDKRDIAQQRLSRQYNEVFDTTIKRWTDQIFSLNPSEKKATFWSPASSVDGFRFSVRKVPIFAELSEQGKPPYPNREKYKSNIKHAGIIVPEPELTFALRSGGHVCDPYPIRGILNNLPYDYDLTTRGIASNLRVGIVCPKGHGAKLVSFLRQLHATQNVTSRDMYVSSFSGFQQAFGLPIEIPDEHDDLFKDYDIPSEQPNLKTVRVLAETIVRSIDALHAGSNPNVVLIYVPKHMGAYRSFETDQERFDLHDFVKAACVRKGYTTQFLEEPTIDSGERCNIMWWLSLALYTKSMRTPWVLNGIDDKTAFVGLGFSVNRFNTPGKHVLVGCSHIYGPTGEGLQYRLSKIDSPVIYQKNPFLSKTDALRLGEGIREMFYQSRATLPNRVVIHKSTPFRREEQDGLFEGLDGVSNIELIELNNNFSLRYLNSHIQNGKIAIDSFPVRRGSVVKIDYRTALLWIHGVVGSPTKANYSYYQGGRRIPSPIIIRRYSGNSELEQIAFELLGLSKMDWNTFDLYSKLPATIHTSDEIARVGKYLESFSTSSYDYRLFM